MYKTLNLAFVGITLAVAFFVFSGQRNSFMVQDSYAPFRQPAMIPGAEATRPEAAKQTERINDLMSELREPASLQD